MKRKQWTSSHFNGCTYNYLEAQLLTGVNKIVETMDTGKGKLLSNAAEMEELMAKLGWHLHEYCDAVRDRQFMRISHELGYKYNPFIISSRSKNMLEAKLMSELLPKQARRVLTREQDKKMAKLPGGPWEHRGTLKAQTERTVIALIGSVMLVLPMTFMIFWGRSRAWRVATVATCTAVFALVLARYSYRTPLEVLQATAAYTAILVVFVPIEEDLF
ncbi:hypothetical protein K469DRAFT_697324 [Zopfia rhizophila CBS 207.26]|uniref:DUF6594 domain-containing protein n=1 Tax=Zopfia rhizophila CBS 207.26 TaxID=1314779 RepID=A0A6A6DDX7_9PEZI|nr:hypothetical protein K469DRAFT_697324 [Zopfia rhizophila CBS 207.26]